MFLKRPKSFRTPFQVLSMLLESASARLASTPDGDAPSMGSHRFRGGGADQPVEFLSICTTFADVEQTSVDRNVRMAFSDPDALTRPNPDGPACERGDRYPCGMANLGQFAANRPRSTFLNRALLPLVLISCVMAA